MVKNRVANLWKLLSDGKLVYLKFTWGEINGKMLERRVVEPQFADFYAEGQQLRLAEQAAGRGEKVTLGKKLKKPKKPEEIRKLESWLEDPKDPQKPDDGKLKRIFFVNKPIKMEQGQTIQLKQQSDPISPSNPACFYELGNEYERD